MGPLNPYRVSATLYPSSVPAIKLNGRTNHIANVSMKPGLQRCVAMAESISEIAHWHAPLSLTARRSSLIQKASRHTGNVQTPLTRREKNQRHRHQLFVPCGWGRNPRSKQDNQIISPTRLYSQRLTVCWFDWKKKKTTEGDFYEDKWTFYFFNEKLTTASCRHLYAENYPY